MSNVRLATEGDRDQFLALYKKFLEEHGGIHGDILPTERSMEFFGWLFDNVVSGDVPGAIIVTDDLTGFSISALPNELPWDTTLGRAAIGFGTYVVVDERGLGLSRELRDMLLVELSRKGFNAVLGTAFLDNVNPTHPPLT